METVQVKNKYREERNAYLLGTLSSSFKNLESSIRSSKGVFENTINRSNWRPCIAVVVTGYDKLRQAGYDKCFQGSHIYAPAAAAWLLQSAYWFQPAILKQFGLL